MKFSVARHAGDGKGVELNDEFRWLQTAVESLKFAHCSPIVTVHKHRWKMDELALRLRKTDQDPTACVLILGQRTGLLDTPGYSESDGGGRVG